jgi:hypothetical protein
VCASAEEREKDEKERDERELEMTRETVRRWDPVPCTGTGRERRDGERERKKGRREGGKEGTERGRERRNREREGKKEQREGGGKGTEGGRGGGRENSWTELLGRGGMATAGRCARAACKVIVYVYIRYTIRYSF